MDIIKKLLSKKLIVVGLVIVGAGLVVFASTRQDRSPYKLDSVGRTGVYEQVTESGEIIVPSQTDMYSPTNGIIQEIYVQNDDFVEEGEKLFIVKSTATEQEQQAAYANYLAAKTALNTAQSTRYALQADMFEKWDTFKDLAESDHYEDDNGNPKYENRALPEFHIAEKDWLAAQEKYIDQQEAIAQARAKVSSTWLLYQATQSIEMTATATGTVTNLAVRQGNSVSASGEPVLTIADLGEYGVLISVVETDINKIVPGLSARVEVDPIDDKAYQGIVERIDRIGHEDGNVNTYDVYVVIKDPDEQLRAGMSADVEIVTEEVEDVLSVPNSAVRSVGGGRSVQIVGADNELELIPVTIGVKGEERTQILSGLDEDQEIVVSSRDDQNNRSGLFGF